MARPHVAEPGAGFRSLALIFRQSLAKPPESISIFHGGDEVNVTLAPRFQIALELCERLRTKTGDASPGAESTLQKPDHRRSIHYIRSEMVRDLIGLVESRIVTVLTRAGVAGARPVRTIAANRSSHSSLTIDTVFARTSPARVVRHEVVRLLGGDGAPRHGPTMFASRQTNTWAVAMWPAIQHHSVTALLSLPGTAETDLHRPAPHLRSTRRTRSQAIGGVIGRSTPVHASTRAEPVSVLAERGGAIDRASLSPVVPGAVPLTLVLGAATAATDAGARAGARPAARAERTYHRGDTPNQAAPRPQPTGPPPPTAPAIDIDGLDRELWRRFEKRVRVERARRGRG